MEKLKPTEVAEGAKASAGAERIEDRKERALADYAKNVGDRARRVLVDNYKNKTDGRALAFAELSKTLHEYDPNVPVVEMAPNASLDEVTQQAEGLAATATRIVKESGIDVTNNNNGKPYPAIVERLHNFEFDLPWGMITGSLMTPDRANAIRAADAERKKNPPKHTDDELQYPGFGGGGF
jgi:hypothetical protein